MLSLIQIEKDKKDKQNMILCILKAHNFAPFFYGFFFFKQGSFLALTLLAEVSLVFTVGEEKKQKRQNMKTKERRNNKAKPLLAGCSLARVSTQI